MPPRENATVNVLVVEDETDLRATVVTLIELLGYRVIEAADTDIALEIINGDASIDLLFSDVVTPGKCDGVELAERALAHRPALKVILTTGYDDDPDRVVEHFAPWPILFKPYQCDDLAKAFAEILDQETIDQES